MTRPAKRPTSADVARAAGVSRATVSYVLNDRPGQSIPPETRRRIVEAARRLDYRPHASARALAAGRSGIVLLAIPELPIGPGISRLIEELDAALADHGLTLVTHLAGSRRRPLPDVCAGVGASAVIGLESFDDGTVEALHRAGAEIVFPVRDVAPAMNEIGRMQADHLIERGHRRLGYAMPADPALARMAEARLQGVTASCAAAALAPPVVLQVNLNDPDTAPVVAGWTAREVTAVCAYNDEIAIAVLAGMRDQGLGAPADLAVIGADDIPTARFAGPPLTTVCFDAHEVGRRRAEAIVAGLTGGQRQSAPAQLPLKLVERLST